jgi:regulatory protein
MKPIPSKPHNSFDDGDEFEQVTRSSESRKTPSKGAVRVKPKASAKSKALSLLARREHSRKELQTKLLQRGYSEEEVAQAVDWASTHQLQSDERFKQSLIRRRSPVLGDRVLEAELSQHGLSANGKHCAVLSNDGSSGQPVEDDADALLPESERAFAWLKRRYESPLLMILEEEGEGDKAAAQMALKAKAMRALGARGFDFGNIQKAWKRLLDEFESDA